VVPGPSSTSGESQVESGGTPINWDVVTRVIGAVAAVAGWMAVVGGAREWARLHNAGIPSIQTLTGSAAPAPDRGGVSNAAVPSPDRRERGPARLLLTSSRSQLSCQHGWRMRWPTRSTVML
jgi:hypothetical protein